MTLDRAGVPPTDKWRTLILYMRSLESYGYLSDDQKFRIQSLIMETLQNRDFSDQTYSEILRKKEDILNTPCNRKLQAAIEETAAMVRQFQGLLTSRKGAVEELGANAVGALQSGKDPAELISELREAFAKVVMAMEEDSVNMAKLSKTDALTGINNRRVFDETLETVIAEWAAKSVPVALLMIDIDHFKKFNDTYGHRIGDQALIAVAGVVQRVGAMVQDRARGLGYIPARYGGEEFAVILSGMDQDQAMDVAEELREQIRTYNFVIRDANREVLKRGIQITVSIGVAEMNPKWRGAFAENIIDSADKALYVAKAEGRDRVKLYTSTLTASTRAA